MDPNFWGPGLWKYIHSVAAMATTTEQRQDFKALVQLLARTLPCNKCKEHFQENLRRHDINRYMTDEHSLFTWTYIMHNAVNIAQGKTGDKKPSFNDVLRVYFDVGDDQDAVGEFPLDDAICRDICSGTITPDTLEPKTRMKTKSSARRKFKVEKK